MADHLNTAIFGIYPYIALAVLALGSIIRYDREPYTWRSGSSQLLRRRQQKASCPDDASSGPTSCWTTGAGGVPVVAGASAITLRLLA